MVKRFGYHHVALRVRDFAKTVAFYEKLGCTLVRTWGPEDKPMGMMDVGGGNLIEIFSGGKEDPEQDPKFEHIALKSENPDADFAAALAAGAKPHTEPKDVNIGGSYPVRIAFVRGLNDEVIEFFQEK